MKALRVLAIDGGLGDLGWVIGVVRDDGAVQLAAAGVVHTEPTKTGKVQGAAMLLGTALSVDSVRRSQVIGVTIAAALDAVDDARHSPDFAIACEAFSPPKGNPTTGLKVGFGLSAAITAGALHARRTARRSTIAQATPTEVKRVLGVEGGLTEAASKAAVRAAITVLMPRLHTLLGGVSNSRAEHAYDAAGVLIACIDRDRFRDVMPMQT